MSVDLSEAEGLSGDQKKILDALLRAHADEARRDLVHPAPEELLAYNEGVLEGEERERIQEHLALCHRCAQVVLDLGEFPELEPAEEKREISEFEVAAEWRRFQKMAAQEEAPQAPPVPTPSYRNAYALAASLMIAVVGLSLWVFQLHDEIDQPRVNVHIGDLRPQAEGIERGDPDRIQVPDGAEHVLLLLNLADFREFGGYRVEIADREGREVWSSEALRRSRDGNFTVEVHRRLLPAGEYRIELFGLEDGERTRIASYTAVIGFP